MCGEWKEPRNRMLGFCDWFSVSVCTAAVAIPFLFTSVNRLSSFEEVLKSREGFESLHKELLLLTTATVVSYFNGDIILMQWYLCRLYCWEIQTLGELCNVSWEFGVYPLIIFFFLMQLFEVWCLPDNLVWLFIAIFMPWKYAGVRWGMLDHVLW